VDWNYGHLEIKIAFNTRSGKKNRGKLLDLGGMGVAIGLQVG